MRQLEVTFDLDRLEGYALDAELERAELARPGIKLLPRDPAAASLVVAFTTFPGLVARFGRWFVDAFPACGCDACGEIADGEIARLARMVDALIAGRFRETLWIPNGAEGWQAATFWFATKSCSQRTRLERTRAQQMLASTA